jgi:hypothetical protein
MDHGAIGLQMDEQDAALSRDAIDAIDGSGN